MKRVSAVPLLARRFLLSKASDKFLSFIAWVSVVGVALGVLALTIVTSVINGFEGELVHLITGMNGDVALYSREAVSDAPTVEAKIRKAVPETEAITASFIAELMVAGPTGVAGAAIEGINAETYGTVTTIPQKLTSGRLPTADGEVVLMSALAERIGATVGSEIRLIAPFAGGSGLNGSNGDDEHSTPANTSKATQAQVVGIAQMGMYEYDSKYLFASLGSLQKFIDQPGKVTTFKIKLKPGTDARAIADRLSDSFGYPFRAKDWSQLNRNWFYAIKLEKAVIGIILTVIVIVAAFNVVSTLMMMIHDKTKEIAILKAMGFRSRQSFQLFCMIGMGIGIVGTAVGISLGLMFGYVLGKTRWIHLPADIYKIGYLPVTVHWTEIALIAFVALLITFAATLYPGYKVSTRSPLDGLRYD